MEKYDYLVVGAGISGCTISERLASFGRKVLLIDKRDHLGGNCFDFYDSAGVLIHKYGPHYFRTDSPEVEEYLSNFTRWIPHRYKVKVRIGNKLFSFPINKKTLEQFFSKKFKSEKEVEFFVNSLKDQRIKIPKNAEEQVLCLIGEKIYKSFFEGYTQKQWGISPKELDPSVTARIPIRFNEDDDYLRERFQAMPQEGYTQMIKKMVGQKNITLKLNTPYRKDFKNIAKKIIWTGRIDEYFDFKFGKLPYRSLNFLFTSFYNKSFVQEEGQINYPSLSVPYTRIVEIKHVTHQNCPNTTLSIETPSKEGDPYYPLPTKEANYLYERYLEESKKEEGVYFLGRLAKYKYLNMDQCVLEALNLFSKIS